MKRNSIFKQSAERPNPRTSLFKQLHLVSRGTYLATYILKPNEQYPTATVSTRDFCVREKAEDWEVIRLGLLDAWKKGELIAIEFTGKDYEYISFPNENPEKIGYERTDFGVKLFYPTGFDLFYPLEETSNGNGSSALNLEDLI